MNHSPGRARALGSVESQYPIPALLLHALPAGRPLRPARGVPDDGSTGSLCFCLLVKWKRGVIP